MSAGSSALRPHLWIQTAFLGDLALSVPALQNLRKLNPQRPIWLLCRQGLGEFLLDFKLVDRVFTIQKKNSASYREAFAELRRQEWEWILCPHESVTTARWVWGLRAERKVSFRQFWNGFVFTDRVRKDPALPEALRQLSILGAVHDEVRQQITSTPPEDFVKTSLPLRDPPLYARMQITQAPAENLISIFPGSVWPTKKWTETGFAELVAKIRQHGFEVELMGSPNEFAECERIGGSGVKNLAGRLTLTESIRRISRARLVISNDSGGSHLGALAGVPVLTIFGPTVIGQGFRPWSQNSGAIWHDLDCRPCGAHGHQKCPLGHHHCMRKLSADIVWDAAHRLLR